MAVDFMETEEMLNPGDLVSMTDEELQAKGYMRQFIWPVVQITRINAMQHINTTHTPETFYKLFSAVFPASQGTTTEVKNNEEEVFIAFWNHRLSVNQAPSPENLMADPLNPYKNNVDKVSIISALLRGDAGEYNNLYSRVVFQRSATITDTTRTSSFFKGAMLSPYSGRFEE